MARVEDIQDEDDSAYTSATDISLRRPQTGNSSTKPLLVVPTPTAESDPTGSRSASTGTDDGESNFTEEVFDTALITVPFTFLYILLDVLVHMQYRHRPTIPGLLSRLLTAIPTLAITLFYTNRHANHTLTRSFLMTASIFSGARLIWLVNKAGWSLTTEQAPAMGTIWILTIVQLPLSRAVLALAGVAGWVWWMGMKVYP